MATVVTGDDVEFLVSLRKDGESFAITPSATIKAALVNQQRTAILAGPQTCNSTDSGADWLHSLVKVTLSSSLTGAVTTYAPAFLEVEVSDPGKLTWFVPVTIVKGNI